MADVLAEDTLVEGIMACRNRGMGSEKRRSPYYLECLAEAEIVFLDIFAESFESDEGSMTFIAVVDLRIEAEIAESADEKIRLED